MCHGVSLVETVAVGGIFLRQCCVFLQISWPNQLWCPNDFFRKNQLPWRQWRPCCKAEHPLWPREPCSRFAMSKWRNLNGWLDASGLGKWRPPKMEDGNSLRLVPLVTWLMFFWCVFPRGPCFEVQCFVFWQSRETRCLVITLAPHRPFSFWRFEDTCNTKMVLLVVPFRQGEFWLDKFQAFKCEAQSWRDPSETEALLKEQL